MHCSWRHLGRLRHHMFIFEQEGLGHPTYFEYLFLMFMWMVRRKKPEYVILETGLGGRLDATNCIEHPALTVITSISLDHMEYLGGTVTQIAGEKAGILKKNMPVVYDDTDAAASAVIRNRAAELSCPAYPISPAVYTDLRREHGGMRPDDKREKPASVYSLRSGISGGQRLHRLPGGAASCSGRGDSGSGHPECGMARTHGGDPGRSLSGWRSQ